MKLNFSFLMALPFVLLGTQGNAQTQKGSVVDENGKIHFTVKPQQGNNSTVFSKLNPTALNLDWSGPENNASNSPDEDSWEARLAVGPNSSASVVYNENNAAGTALQKIMFSKKTGATTWSEPILVDTGGEIGQRNTHIPGISAAPNGDLHVIYHVWAYENFRHYMGYSHYTAATGTWSEGVKISDLGGTISNSATNEIYSTEDSLPVALWGYDDRSGNEAIYLTYFDGTNWSSDIAISQLQAGHYGFAPKMRSIGNHKALILYIEFSNGVYEYRYRIYNEITHELSEPKIINLGDVITYELSPASAIIDGKVAFMFKYTNSSYVDVVKVGSYDIATDTFSVNNAAKEMPDVDSSWLVGWDCNQTGDCAILASAFQEPISLITFNSQSEFSDLQELVAQSSSFNDIPLVKFDVLGNLHTSWADTRSGGMFKKEIYYKEAMNLNLGTGHVNKAKISVYPNPFHDVISISDVQNVKSISVTDMTGRTIKNLAPSSQLYLSNLKQGVYFVNLTMKDGSVQTVKVIKK